MIIIIIFKINVFPFVIAELRFAEFFSHFRHLSGQRKSYKARSVFFDVLYPCGQGKQKQVPRKVQYYWAKLWLNKESFKIRTRDSHCYWHDKKVQTKKWKTDLFENPSRPLWHNIFVFRPSIVFPQHRICNTLQR